MTCFALLPRRSKAGEADKTCLAPTHNKRYFGKVHVLKTTKGEQNVLHANKLKPCLTPLTDYSGLVNRSHSVSIPIALSALEPHISSLGRKLRQTAGRSA